MRRDPLAISLCSQTHILVDAAPQVERPTLFYCVSTDFAEWRGLTYRSYSLDSGLRHKFGRQTLLQPT